MGNALDFADHALVQESCMPKVLDLDLTYLFFQHIGLFYSICAILFIFYPPAPLNVAMPLSLVYWFQFHHCVIDSASRLLALYTVRLLVVA